jgi:hypothetical protein
VETAVLGKQLNSLMHFDFADSVKIEIASGIRIFPQSVFAETFSSIS